MKKWAFVLGAAAAMGAAAVVVGLALRRAEEARSNEVPAIIDDCFERIQRIESELQRLRPAPGPAT